MEAEKKRLRQIESAVQPPEDHRHAAEFGITETGWGKHADRVAQLHASAVAGDLSVDELLTELRPLRTVALERTIPMARTVSASTRDGHHSVIEAALCIKAGLSSLEKHFPEPVLHQADKLRDVGLQLVLLTNRFSLRRVTSKRDRGNSFPAIPLLIRR